MGQVYLNLFLQPLGVQAGRKSCKAEFLCRAFETQTMVICFALWDPLKHTITRSGEPHMCIFFGLLQPFRSVLAAFTIKLSRMCMTHPIVNQKDDRNAFVLQPL